MCITKELRKKYNRFYTLYDHCDVWNVHLGNVVFFFGYFDFNQSFLIRKSFDIFLAGFSKFLSVTNFFSRSSVLRVGGWRSGLSRHCGHGPAEHTHFQLYDISDVDQFHISEVNLRLCFHASKLQLHNPPPIDGGCHLHEPPDRNISSFSFIIHFF